MSSVTVAPAASYSASCEVRGRHGRDAGRRLWHAIGAAAAAASRSNFGDTGETPESPCRARLQRQRQGTRTCSEDAAVARLNQDAELSLLHQTRNVARRERGAALPLVVDLRHDSDRSVALHSAVLDSRSCWSSLWYCVTGVYSRPQQLTKMCQPRSSRVRRSWRSSGFVGRSHILYNFVH